MSEKYYRMPIQKKVVEKGRKRVYLYNKEFKLKEHIIKRERDYYSKNNIDFTKLKVFTRKGNEILIKFEFDAVNGVFIETWVNKTKYLRVRNQDEGAKKQNSK